MMLELGPENGPTLQVLVNETGWGKMILNETLNESTIVILSVSMNEIGATTKTAADCVVISDTGKARQRSLLHVLVCVRGFPDHFLDHLDRVPCPHDPVPDYCDHGPARFLWYVSILDHHRVSFCVCKKQKNSNNEIIKT